MTWKGEVKECGHDPLYDSSKGNRRGLPSGEWCRVEGRLWYREILSLTICVNLSQSPKLLQFQVLLLYNRDNDNWPRWLL